MGRLRFLPGREQETVELLLMFANRAGNVAARLVESPCGKRENRKQQIIYVPTEGVSFCGSSFFRGDGVKSVDRPADCEHGNHGNTYQRAYRG